MYCSCCNKPFKTDEELIVHRVNKHKSFSTRGKIKPPQNYGPITPEKKEEPKTKKKPKTAMEKEKLAKKKSAVQAIHEAMEKRRKMAKGEDDPAFKEPPIKPTKEEDDKLPGGPTINHRNFG